MQTNDIWKVRESMEMEEVVASPMESRLFSGNNPLRSSSGRSSKSAIKAVCLCLAAHFTMSNPPMMAKTTPAVAVVIAKLRASSHPKRSKAAPMAAAVPCPP